MGFARPNIPTASADTAPPVVAVSEESETQAGYAQDAAHRRGLLSTILSTHRQSTDDAPGGRSTLG